MLAAVDLSPLGDAVRSEPSRGGQLFPHIHGVLPVDAVVSVWAAGANPRRGGEVARLAPITVVYGLIGLAQKQTLGQSAEMPNQPNCMSTKSGTAHASALAERVTALS